MPDYQPRGDGRSPLENLPEFVNTTCPACGGPARRETDTMGGFACSSWYFLRFADPWYDSGPFNPEAVRRWLPVDLYVGGAEHAVMHLLYARFWTKVLADAGLLHFREPFPRLRSQGVLHAQDGRRMSKSRGNVITPDEVVERTGADILRVHLLGMAPFENDVIWDEEGLIGAQRFLERVWKVCQARSTEDTKGTEETAGASAAAADSLVRIVHRTIQRVTRDIEAFKFNTAFAAMAGLVNALSEAPEKPSFACDVLIRLLAPFAPHIAEELWVRRGRAFSVHQQAWPEYDPELAADETVTLVVQVNGRVRDRIGVPAGIADDEARQLALASERVRAYVSGQPRKVIVVHGRLVNIVV
jgi:leucyl-tRNA synthetase